MNPYYIINDKVFYVNTDKKRLLQVKTSIEHYAFGTIFYVTDAGSLPSVFSERFFDQAKQWNF